MEVWGFSVEGVWLPRNFQRSLAAKLCVRSPKVLEVQQHARGPLSPFQIWLGSDFTRRRGGKNVELLLPAALREAQTCRYLVYSEADFEVFRPAGATRCTDGGEIWHRGGDRITPNYTPIGATTRV